MKAAFVTGYAYTVESYWRVMLPARALRVPALGAEQALADPPELVWIHQPLTLAALSLAQKVKERGGRVVADFSEDVWTRDALGEGLSVYTSTQLRAAEDTVALADLVVVASEGLAQYFEGLPLKVIPPALDALPSPIETVPGLVAWWSDGRQKAGMTEAGPCVRRLVEDIAGRLVHVQFAHMAAVAGLGAEKQAVVVGGAFSPDTLVRHFMAHAGKAEIGLECWPDVPYRESVSDLSLLRYAACGVPALTNREKAPPGMVSAPYEDWPRLARELHEEPGRRRALSIEARAWAESRATFHAYEAVIEEVAP